MKPIKIISILTVGSAFIGLSSTTLSAADPQARILVKPKPGMPETALHARISAHQAVEIGDIPSLDVRILQVPQAASQQLKAALEQDKGIDYVEDDCVAHAIGTSNDPYFVSGSQWYLTKMQVPQAWDSSTGSANGIVAVVDTGVRASHPDIAGKVLPGYDFFNNDADATDDNGHGTAVAGLIGASANNGLGMASLAWANPILPVKALGADGSGSYSSIANAIIWAADNGARVINMSLGGTSSSRTLQDAVNYAWNKNVVLVAAAGNNGNNIPCYPAACTNVVAVSATNSSDGRPTWSNYGSYVDVAAPGVGILTLYGTNSYSYWDGTSFSSPITAGTVALMSAANPLLSNSTLVDVLTKSCDDIGAAGYDVYYGNGRLNASKAVTAAVAATQADVTPPSVAITSPAGGATVSGTVNVNLSATDNTGVARVELYVGGVLLAQSPSASASISWDTTTVTDGTYTLEARAYDPANNVGRVSIQVSVRNSTVADTTAPMVAITSPANGSRIAKTVKITVSASDNVQVSKAELFIDGRLYATSSTALTSFSWNTAKVAAGAHVLQAYAYDAAGNIGASAPITVYK